MKLHKLFEQVVGHWKTFDHPGHIDPKRRKKNTKKDLSFRVKGRKKISKSPKDISGGEDKTQALETGAMPVGHGKYDEMGMKPKRGLGDVSGGDDGDRLHGKPGEVAGGNLKSAQDRTSKNTSLSPTIITFSDLDEILKSI